MKNNAIKNGQITLIDNLEKKQKNNPKGDPRELWHLLIIL